MKALRDTPACTVSHSQEPRLPTNLEIVTSQLMSHCHTIASYCYSIVSLTCLGIISRGNARFGQVRAFRILPTVKVVIDSSQRAPQPRANHPLRIVIADDLQRSCAWLKKMIEQEPHLKVVGVATDGASAVAQVQELKPDVVVLNVVIPKMTGFEAARRIREKVPTPAS